MPLISAVSSRVWHLDHAARVAAAVERSRLAAEVAEPRARRRRIWGARRVTKSETALAAEW